jgi:hypothetical protein
LKLKAACDKIGKLQNLRVLYSLRNYEPAKGATLKKQRGDINDRRMKMRILLSTIGSRGDVQPLVALGLQLKALGQEVHLWAPPDFRDWIESLGMSVTPIGPELRSTGKASPAAVIPPHLHLKGIKLEMQDDDLSRFEAEGTAPLPVTDAQGYVENQNLSSP